MPAIPGYEWSVHYETCTRAGGDYYDFTTLADGRIGILIADASGHGAPAAVLMAMTRTLLHAVAELSPTPDRLLSRLNREMGRLLPAGGSSPPATRSSTRRAGRWSTRWRGTPPPS